MKVVYLGRSSRRSNPPPQQEGDVIELLSDNWDDFSYKTSFFITCRIGEKSYDLGAIRLLIEGANRSSSELDRLLQEGWDGTFPIPELNYISVPSEIAFYEQIAGALNAAEAAKVAQSLHDASYMVRIEQDENALSLVETKGFENSLQRERGSVKAYMDGWRIFSQQDIAVLDLGFNFQNALGTSSKLNLKFQAPNRLPYDVNVLIGPNGCGKSQLLHQIVNSWIAPDEDSPIGFAEKPNLSQLVVVSYSPFEQFPVDLQRWKLQDEESYRYFGLRGRGPVSKDGKPGSISLSHSFPKRDAARSFVDCVKDDLRYAAIHGWAGKVATAESVLKTAIPFDYAAVEVNPKRRPRSFFKDEATLKTFSHFDSNGNRHRFVRVTSADINDFNVAALEKYLVSASGVTFFADGEPVELSSGQRLFAYMVINILGAMRRNSLILVDEPELFLHPTMEIQFVDMLKTILKEFNSKALLATHSVVTVREVPADCVHVFSRSDEGITIHNPVFQTFGGDFQRISSYVFGDKAISKPFEKWIAEQLEDGMAGAELIEELLPQLNEEMIIQIKAMENS